MTYLDEDKGRVGLASKLHLKVINDGGELALGLVGAVVGVPSTGEGGSGKHSAASTTTARSGGRSRSGGGGSRLGGILGLLRLGGEAPAIKAGSLASGAAEHGTTILRLARRTAKNEKYSTGTRKSSP